MYAGICVETNASVALSLHVTCPSISKVLLISIYTLDAHAYKHICISSVGCAAPCGILGCVAVRLRRAMGCKVLGMGCRALGMGCRALG